MGLARGRGTGHPQGRRLRERRRAVLAAQHQAEGGPRPRRRAAMHPRRRLAGAGQGLRAGHHRRLYRRRPGSGYVESKTQLLRHLDDRNAIPSSTRWSRRSSRGQPARHRPDGVRRQDHRARREDRRPRPAAGQLLRQHRLHVLGQPARRRPDRPEGNGLVAGVEKGTGGARPRPRSVRMRSRFLRGRPRGGAPTWPAWAPDREVNDGETATACGREDHSRVEGRRLRRAVGAHDHRSRRGAPLAAARVPHRGRAVHEGLGDLPRRAGGEEARGRALHLCRRRADHERARGAVPGRRDRQVRPARRDRQGRDGSETLAGLKEHGAVYFHAVGGTAQVLAEAVVEVEQVFQLAEFGVPEALWVIRVKDFPVVVTMDSHGGSLHAEVEKASKAKLDQLLGLSA